MERKKNNPTYLRRPLLVYYGINTHGSILALEYKYDKRCAVIKF